MKAKKIALITGITGQDGSYLAELLLSKNYEVHGLVRHVALEDSGLHFSRLINIESKLKLHRGDMRDLETVWRLIHKVKPNEVYHLAAQSDVKVSFEDPVSTHKINTLGTANLLMALKNLLPNVRLYFAGTSEMFGNAARSPQNEDTSFSPVSPYGISKVAAFFDVKLHRTAYGMFACNGILFNHESPRRGKNFVTRKIANAVVRIAKGKMESLELGNLDAKRDWGFSGDYVKAMWLMLQQDNPDDYVVATGEMHTVKEFVEEAFAYFGLDWEKHVIINQKFLRPTDVRELCGDAGKAREFLGWQPEIKFSDLVSMMVEHEVRSII
jgi:GDPmannose 4,6-dehydratase